jgi:hypothetical protein
MELSNVALSRKGILIFHGLKGPFTVRNLTPPCHYQCLNLRTLQT